MNNTSNIKEQRAKLREFSRQFVALKEAGTIRTINEGLKLIYLQQGHTILKTHDQWEQEGKRIKRGAKALYLWGKQTVKTVEENGESKEIKYFPLVALFSENQVYTPNH
jgi:hypothetical protein